MSQPKDLRKLIGWRFMSTRSVLRLLILLSLFVPGSSQAADLLAGPFIGHTTTTSAEIWVETDSPAKVLIDYWLEPQAFEHSDLRVVVIRCPQRQHQMVKRPSMPGRAADIGLATVEQSGDKVLP